MKFVEKFKHRTEERKLLLAKLVLAYQVPFKDGIKVYKPTQEEIDNYSKQVHKLSNKKLKELDGMKNYKLKLDILDRLKSIRKKRYAVVTIFNDNQTTDFGVCQVFNRTFERNKCRYLIMSERGWYSPEFKMRHFFYHANRPFPLKIEKGKPPEDMPDARLLNDTIENGVIEALANLDMSSLIKICLVVGILTFVVTGFLLILQLKGGL